MIASSSSRVMSKTKTLVHASVQFTDIGGLVEGAHKGEGLGNRFLANIREVDAIVYVLRAFPDDDVPGPTDPLDALGVLEIELAIGDIDSAEKQLDKRKRMAKAGDKSLLEEIEALEAAVESLQRGVPVYRSSLTTAQRELLKPLFLLTNKPVLAVVNIGEDQLADVDAIVAPVKAELKTRRRHRRVHPARGRGVADVRRGPHRDARRARPRRGARCHASSVRRTTRSVCGRTSRPARRRPAPGRSTRAPRPRSAPASSTPTSSVGFIRAETIMWDELIAIGSWAAAKEQGKVRSEGKEYVVQDGDTMEFRFNV